jgi:hypothetical protein
MRRLPILEKREDTMKWCVLLLAVLLLAPCSAPALDPGTKIRDGFVDIDVSYRSVPFVTDYNCDGKKDLLVGEHILAATDYGKIRVYLNYNTDDNPLFAGWSYAQYTSGANSYDIQLSGSS